MKRVISFALALMMLAGWATLAPAKVAMPAIFGDHMVLQRAMKAPIWGTADPGEKITVTFAGQKLATAADDKGAWKVELEPMVSSIRPRVLTVKGSNTLTFDDVLVGEVWICSGQSNMAYAASAGLLNQQKEIDGANQPRIRMIKVKPATAKEPLSNFEGKWAACTPEVMSQFSAVAYFYARDLQRRLDMPIGLIGTYWGGTPAQAWTRLGALEADPELKSYLARWAEYTRRFPEAQKIYETRLATWKKAVEAAKAQNRPAPAAPRLDDPETSPNRPANLYNAMIHPLIPFACRGAIWYQGESNTSTPEEAMLYAKLFATMIGDWRKQWGRGDFPFLYVQLANYRRRFETPTESNWALLREAQLKTLQVPNTGMAVIIDAGEANNIHPRNKQIVGQRLALAAAKVAYDRDVEWTGPVFDRMHVEAGKIVLGFKGLGGGLVSKSEPLKGFAIAGADKRFVWADAKIVGDTVEVSSPAVKEPVAVRYAWADNPEASLYNKADLPASPFRTDSWEAATAQAEEAPAPVQPAKAAEKKSLTLKPIKK